MSEDYWIFENEINEEIPWKLDKRMYGGKKHSFPHVDVTPTFIMTELKTWHLALIMRALTGRLKNEDDVLMAKMLGYTLMKRKGVSGRTAMGHEQNVLKVAEEELEDLVDSYHELMQRMKEDLMGENK